MPLSEKRYTIINNAIKTLFERRVFYKKTGLTHDDLMEFFVAPEDREAVIAAGKLFSHARGGTFAAKVPDAQGREVKLWVAAQDVKGHKAFMQPNYIGKKFFGNPESEAYQRLQEYLSWRTDIGRAFGRTQAVFLELNNRCETVSQMRFVWPSLVALAGVDEATQGLADQIREHKAPTRLPAIHPVIRQWAHESAELITQSLLLPNHQGKEKPSEQVEIGVTFFETDEKPWDPGSRCAVY